MNQERTRKCFRQVEHIRGHLNICPILTASTNRSLVVQMYDDTSFSWDGVNKCGYHKTQKTWWGILALYLNTFNFASSIYHLISLHCITHEELIKRFVKHLRVLSWFMTYNQVCSYITPMGATSRTSAFIPGF
jgi:hypothetical protein